MILLLACATPTSDTAEPQGNGPTLSEVSYAVTWDAEGIERTVNGLEVRNDLGWTFEVDEAWVVDRAWQLTACEEELALVFPVWLGLARAGHGDDDVSVLTAPVASDLIADGTVHLDTVTFTDTAYCTVHVLSAYATSDTLGLPGDPDLVGYTLWIQGTARRDDTTVELDLSSASADGALYDLPSGGYGGLDVHVTRSIAGLFDGVDPTNDDAGRVALANLVDQQLVELTLR